MTEADDLQALLDKCSPEVQPLMQELRRVVMTALPSAIEHVHLGYGNIHYQTGQSMRTMLVALDPQRSYVNVEFRHGVDLPDPARKLEGTGKTLRHVKVRTIADAHTSELTALIAEEAKIAGVQ
jgi:hypothetical protein